MNRKAIFATVKEARGRGFSIDDVITLDKVLDRLGVPREPDPNAPPRAGGRKVSERGIALIHRFEDLRLTTYRDPGPTGLPITGGWGSTRDENGRPFKLGFTAPRAYWDRLFRRDLEAKEGAVNLLLGDAPTTQAQFDALVSFAYNCGEDIDDDDIAEGLGDSTLLKKHLRGDYAGAKAEFPKWDKSNGKVLKGLQLRRAAEADLYGSAA